MARSSFLYLIDVAVRELLFNKFSTYLGLSSLGSTNAERINKGVVLIPKPVAQRLVSEKRAENFLEFINVWRDSEQFAWDRNRTIVSRRGMLVQADGEDAENITAVPADLEYQFWLWTRDLDALNDCVETFLFWTHTYPKLAMTLDAKYSLEYDLIFGRSNDESPLDQMFDIGKYFVKSFRFTVKGWIFNTVDASGLEISKIRMDCFDAQQLDTDQYPEIYLEDSNYNTELHNATRMFRARLYGINTLDITTNTLGILNNFSTDFTANSQFFIENSTGNNGKYTVQSVSWDGTNTNITTNETITDETVDGNLYIPQ